MDITNEVTSYISIANCNIHSWLDVAMYSYDPLEKNEDVATYIGTNYM